MIDTYSKKVKAKEKLVHKIASLTNQYTTTYLRERYLHELEEILKVYNKGEAV